MPSSTALTQLWVKPEWPVTPVTFISHITTPPVPTVGPKSALSSQ